VQFLYCLLSSSYAIVIILPVKTSFHIFSLQVRLYDISAQRRPVISFDFRETPIKSVAEDLDGYTVYIGNGSGDLASVDMRTGDFSSIM
jgi:hypothetical protein